ncbi:MAG: PilW family protein, partial [Phycisphaerae bacterium]
VLGLTLVEMVIAMAIMTIIFAVILPQFRIIQNSWDTQAGAAEALQNGRVLIDHLNLNLSKAVRITAVSDPSASNGYIEFQDNDANNVRYDVNSISNYVEFGLVGNLSDLAGPVSKLQFTCYDAIDLSTPITDVNAIRSVKVETTLTNPAKLDQDMTFSTQAYIRTNALPAVGGNISKLSEPWLEFDPIMGMQPALVHMSGTKYLCAYRGDRDDGWACILTVNPADWSVSAAGFLEYDTKSGITPALAKIDDTHFLCAYQGFQGDGFACILYEWPAGSGTLKKGPELEFDPSSGFIPALCQIDIQGDTSHYLCTYADAEIPASVHALVLNVTIIPGVMMDLTSGPSITFASALATQTALAKIDDTHYLCAYAGKNGSNHGAAVVLTINTSDWTITTETHYDFDGEVAEVPALAKIDDTHYLCAYQYPYPSYEGHAVVLTVNPADWSISKEPISGIVIDSVAKDCELCQIDDTNFLCAYRDTNYDGVAVVLTVNTSDWTVSKGMPLMFGATPHPGPALCQIDAGHYLCAHCSLDIDGFTGVIGLSGGIMP